jgi:uroporphyrinogen III methyltransferase/synthase
MSFAGKPLEGKRVVVTRAAHQAEGLAAPLRAYGAEIVLCPMLALAAPRDPEQLPNALRRLDTFDMMIVMSANGANAVNAALRDYHIKLDEKKVLEVLAVGPATAAVLKESGFSAKTPAGAGSAMQLFGKISGEVRNKQVLVVQSEDADDMFVSSLHRVGASVAPVAGYRTEIPRDADENVRVLFTPDFNADVVTFASGRMGENFYEVLARNNFELPRSAVTASLGPRTTAALLRLGPDKMPKLQAAETTSQSLADAIAGWYVPAAKAGTDR